MKVLILTQDKYMFPWLTEFERHLVAGGAITKCSFDHNLVNLNEYDLGISLLYNKIIRDGLFDAPRLGIINVHPSLLPHHRGSCPNFWAIISGDGAGWTAHRMTDEIDRGEIYLQREVPVLDSDTAETLWERLFDDLPEFLFELAEITTSGHLVPLDVEQSDDRVNTLKDFHEAHNAAWFFDKLFARDRQLGRGSIAATMSVHATIRVIRACSFGDYPGFIFDTPDGKVELKARRMEE